MPSFVPGNEALRCYTINSVMTASILFDLLSTKLSEAFQKGPPICYAQWTMERTIGNLGQQIHQPSKPYANLAQEGVRHSQINALLAIMPELDSPPKSLPSGSIDLGDGYALLRKHSRHSIYPDDTLSRVLHKYLPAGQELP